jgi:hypothetical protein
MAEPEDLLREMPPESPPPEIVLSALRVFRYRAIAAIALALALVVSAFVIKSELDEDARFMEQVGEAMHDGGVSQDVQVRTVDGVEVMFWELVWGDGTVYVHVLAWDEGGRDFSLDILDPTLDGRRATSVGINRSGGGSLSGITHTDLWEEFGSFEGPSADITFDVHVTGPDISGTTSFRYPGEESP